jgi:hypothetical protein
MYHIFGNRGAALKCRTLNFVWRVLYENVKNIVLHITVQFIYNSRRRVMCLFGSIPPSPSKSDYVVVCFSKDNEERA